MSRLSLKNQKGFTVIEGLLIALVVIALAGIGYYVYTQQQTEDTNESTATTAESTEATEEATDVEENEVDEEALEWQKVTSGQGGFSIHIPDGWELVSNTQRDFLFGQDIAYEEGKPVIITTVDGGGSDTNFRFTVHQYPKKELSLTTPGQTVEEYKTSTLTGKKYYKKYPVEPIDGVGPYPGQETYIYAFTKGNEVTYVTYDIFNYNQYSKNILNNFTESDPNRVELIERVVNTLKIN